MSIPLLTNEFYGAVLKKNLSEGHRIYWLEIINNAHIASIMSIHRQVDWTNAIILSYDSKNYLSFCASLRGLLESVADTNYSLQKVPGIIHKFRKEIGTAIKKICNTTEDPKTPFKFITCSNLEEDLLHFTFARRLSKSEKSPKYHAAQPNTEYINSLGNKKYLDLYSYLCQITHPAMPSIMEYFDISEDKDGYKQRIDLIKDKSPHLISELISEYKNEITGLLKIGFNLPYMTLQAINELNYKPLYIKTLESLGFEKK